jgi:DNA-binding XRE family transcriptional regulator
MNKASRKALEDAGFRVGTVEEFLGLTDEESRMIELKVALARRIRELRAKSNLTQQELAVKLKSSQSRVAKVEAADPAVSLDLMVRAYFALGGTPIEFTGRFGRRALTDRKSGYSRFPAS